MKCFDLGGMVAAGDWITEKLSQITTREPESFAIRFQYSQSYLPGQPNIELLAVVHIDSVPAPAIHLSIFRYSAELLSAIEILPAELESIGSFLKNNKLPLLNVSAPWELEPVFIPKPWGQEIWYTGIEARGQAEIKAEGGAIPLPWVLHLFPQTEQSPVILLKVLDPLPDQVFGDLYFELHEEKQEVYIVTHVDPIAWPGGNGCIQLGFSPAKRAQYKNDAEFKDAYLKAVKNYEEVRRNLDKTLDEFRLQQGYGLNAPVPAAVLKKWIGGIAESAETLKREQILREEMNSFINNHPLRVGDTLAIPKHVPHALQHGVRVVEFQTPVYERKILSFAQKVLTQDHWDTEEALTMANMDCSPVPAKVLLDAKKICIERVVDFDEFLVERIRLDDGFYDLDSTHYGLIMVITGELMVSRGESSWLLAAGSACLLPKSLQGVRFQSIGSCLFLHAFPQSTARA